MVRNITDDDGGQLASSLLKKARTWRISTGDSNLSDATYKTTPQNLVNKGFNHHQKGTVVGCVRIQKASGLWKTIQKVLEQKRKTQQEAKNLLLQ